MKRILVFDNYDSFTYNLVHLVEKVSDVKADVYRNDRITLDAVDQYDKIILSPGPGIPSEAGLLLPLIRQYASKKSIFGVCLGHQAIAEVFGGKLVNMKTVFHGVATPVFVEKNAGYLFDGLPETFSAGRYHSWIVENEQFPAELDITARDETGRIMALRHRQYDVTGVQFHPESILTEHGEKLLKNFIEH
ncbi:MAG: anthranilate synthase component II [Bacteroidetes bacterium]|nr:MAG: anthranilate synthase component II [Bacteroidota bacterium]